MRCFFLAILGATLLWPGLAAAEGFTVGELAEDCLKCSKDLKTGNTSSQCAFCDGILTGAASTLTLLEKDKTICPPSDLDTHRVRNMFRLWVKKHEEHLEQPAVWGVVESLKDAYHCGAY